MRIPFLSGRQARLRGRKSRPLSCESLEQRQLFNADPVISVDAFRQYWENGTGAKLVAPQATVVDDNANFAGGSLTLTAIDGATRYDRLTVRNQGSGPGQVDLLKHDVTYGGVPIGKLDIKVSVAGTPHVYKEVDGRELRVFISNPPESFPATNRPAIVMIHGGGWNTGGPGALNERAEYLSSRGMVVVLVEYRLMNSTTEPPLICIADVKSSIRWVRTHAAELGINPNRIAAAGSSVGGQMAAQAGMIEGWDDPNDNLSISSRPNALALSYPTIDNGPGRWGYGRMGDLYDELGPSYNVSSDDPPTIGFFGDADIQVPADVSLKFKEDMDRAGVRLDFHMYQGAPHGFDFYRWDNPYFYDTMRKTDAFFVSLGWITGQPNLTMPASEPPDTFRAGSTITFNQNATPQAVQAVMRNIVLWVPDDPGDKLRKITWSLNDGAGGLSNLATSETKIVPQNDPPQLSVFGTAVYVEGAPAYILAPGTVITDPDSEIMNGATLTVTSTDRWDVNDRIAIQHAGTGAGQVGISGTTVSYGGKPIGTFSGGHGNTRLRVVFNDGTSRAAIEAVVRRVSFRALGVNPLPGQRTISYVVFDGSSNGTSRPAIKYVQVKALNSAPVLDTTPQPVLKSILQGAENPRGTLVKDLVAGAISDVDGAGQGIAITGLGRIEQGVWQFSLDGGAVWQNVGTAPSMSSALLLPSNASTMIRFIPNPSFSGQASVYYRAWDRTQGITGGRWNLVGTGRVGGYSAFSEQVESAVLTVTPRSRPPKVVLGGTINYTEKAAPIVLAAGASVSDPDSAHLNGGSLIARLASNGHADDRLEIRHQGTGAGQIGKSGANVTFGGAIIGTFSGGTGTVPLRIDFTSNAATPAAAQALVRQITFRTLGPNPSTATRSIVFVARDGRGGASSPSTATKTVTVTAVNDNPVLVLGGTIGYQRDAAAVLLASGANVSDVDSPNFDTGRLTVRIDTGASSANRLGIAGSFAIDANRNLWYGGQNIGVLNAGGGVGTTTLVVIFRAPATPAVVQLLVRAINFKTVGGAAGTRTVLFSLTDGDGGSSVDRIKTVNVT